MKSCAVAAALALFAAQPAAAQTSAPEAIALVESYLDAHNAHDLAGTLAHYHPDASFQLNMGRPLVRGRSAIAELERFDAVAESMLLPFGWSAAHDGKGWAVSVRGVIENSRIFSALGLDIVMAVPNAPIFVLKDGLIVQAIQPPLQAACLLPIQNGFTALATWLNATASPLAPTLTKEGRMVLKPELLPAIIEQIGRWRAASGWAPAPAQLRACAVPPA